MNGDGSDWPRLLPPDLVVAAARLGPLGKLPAPGTWGAFAGLLAYTGLFAERLGVAGTLVLSALAFGLAVGICGEAERRLGRRDPGEVILDEFVAMPLCFLGWTAWEGVLPRWGIFLLGFGLFRLFDIAKPFGIRRLQALPGGWGIVVDDTAAALATSATLLAARWAVARF
jgi:phosphatidylglycerophosphatase A